MDTTRQKLIDTIQKSVDGCSEYWAGLIADGILQQFIVTRKDENLGFDAGALEKCKREGL